MSLKDWGKKLFLVGFIFLGAQVLVYISLAFLTKPTNTSVTQVCPNFQAGYLDEVKIVDSLLKEFGCSPFVVSLRVLSYLLVLENKGYDNQYVNCTDGDDGIVFGLDSSCIQKMEAEDFVDKLEDQGYMISSIKNHKIIGLPPKMIVLKCAVLFKKTHPFLILILHSREDNFWWHGSINNDPHGENTLAQAGLRLSDTVFIHDEGAIPKVELKEAQILSLNFLVPKNISAFFKMTSRPYSKFIECDYKRADRYFTTYGRDQSIKAIRFQHQAWKLLSRAKRILDDLEVPFWLSSGTCLGYLRQCDIIPYSQDVDIGVFAKDYKKELLPAFLSHGFKLHHTFGEPNDSYQIAFEYNKIKLDIFFFYSEKNRQIVWNGGTEARSGYKFKYTFPAFTLCWTEFLELLVRVPCNTMGYIEANYGPNWFTPITKWSWKSSPSNVKRNGVWPKEEWSKVINIA